MENNMELYSKSQIFNNQNKYLHKGLWTIIVIVWTGIFVNIFRYWASISDVFEKNNINEFAIYILAVASSLYLIIIRETFQSFIYWGLIKGQDDAKKYLTRSIYFLLTTLITFGFFAMTYLLGFAEVTSDFVIKDVGLEFFADTIVVLVMVLSIIIVFWRYKYNGFNAKNHIVFTVIVSITLLTKVLTVGMATFIELPYIAYTIVISVIMINKNRKKVSE